MSSQSQQTVLGIFALGDKAKLVLGKDSNYQTWSIKISTALEMMGLLNFVDGSSIRPSLPIGARPEPSSDALQAFEAQEALIKAWDSRNVKAFCSLVWNMAEDAADIAIQSLGTKPTARSLWVFLEKRAQPTTTGVLFEALTRFFHFDASHYDSIGTAWQSLESINNELCRLSIPNESEFNAAPWLFKFAFLQSLPKEYEAVVDFLELELNKTSLEETLAHLTDKEHQLRSRDAEAHKAQATAAALKAQLDDDRKFAATASNSRYPPRAPVPLCTDCKKISPWTVLAKISGGESAV